MKIKEESEIHNMLFRKHTAFSSSRFIVDSTEIAGYACFDSGEVISWWVFWSLGFAFIWSVCLIMWHVCPVGGKRGREIKRPTTSFCGVECPPPFAVPTPVLRLHRDILVRVTATPKCRQERQAWVEPQEHLWQNMNNFFESSLISTSLPLLFCLMCCCELHWR